MIPLSIDIPVDNPTKLKIRLHAAPPSHGKSHYRWNTQVFDEEKMSELLQQTHDIPSFITWLHKKMMMTDTYLVERGLTSKRSRMNIDDQDDFSTYNKSMKMEIDE
jgi:hypothetical protein